MTPQKPPVLLVDDEAQILDSLRDLLEESFEVVSTTDPRRALEILANSNIAVILADQRMPGITGDEFLARAQAISDATRILITGYTDIEALARAVNDGQIFTCLAKPWDPQQLRLIVLKAARHCEEMARRKRAVGELEEQRENLARSEAALRKQTKLLQSILDSMGEAVLVVNGTGEIVLKNPAARHLVMPTLENVTEPGHTARHGIYHPETKLLYPVEQLPLARAMRGESVDNIDMFIQNARFPDGAYLSVNVRPLMDEAAPAHGGVAVIRDVTLSKKSESILRVAKEEAERANQAKSEFLSRMSHELRTPLNSILGFAQLLELAELDEENQDNVKQILKGGYLLIELINEILDLARIEAGRISLSTEPVLFREVLSDVLDLVKPLARSAQVSLIADQVLSCDRYVHADHQRLKQVLLNIVVNAVKFNREQGLVHITCETLPDAKRYRICVADTGKGISPEGLKKLFRPFERLDADRAGIGGTGLGLALSKRLIEAMGGTISVESALGVGSRFLIEIGLEEEAVAEAPSDGELDAAEAASAAAQIRAVVLYIEDNPSNLQLVERIFAQRPGVQLITTTQGSLGIELAEAHKPDWILLDLHLPDMGGEDVLKRLKASPATENIPVVILSADATPGRIKRLLENGAQEFLTKPFNVRDLLRLLERTLSSQSAPQEVPPSLP